MLDYSAFVLTTLAALAPQQPPDPPKTADAPTADPVIATVLDKEIRLSDLIDEVNRQIPLNFYHRRVPAEKMAEFQRDAFDKLVVKHLIHLDAVASGLQVTEAELQDEFAKALQEAGDPYTKMEAAAKEALFQEVRPALVRRTLIRKNEERLVARLPKTDEKRMREIYDERIQADRTAFLAPKEAHFYQIFVAVDPARIRLDEDTKKTKIEAARAELAQGKPFASVARIYSEDEFAEKGGDIGYQQFGSFRMSAVNAEAFALAKGQTSEVIRSLHGFHLVHCADIKPEVRHSFAEMRPAIEQWLREEHLKLARERWLADLRQKYPVEMRRPDLLEAPAEAPPKEPSTKKEPAPPTAPGAGK